MNRTIRKRMGIFTGKGTDNAQDFELERLYCPGFQLKLLSGKYFFVYCVGFFLTCLNTHVLFNSWNFSSKCPFLALVVGMGNVLYRFPDSILGQRFAVLLRGGRKP